MHRRDFLTRCAVVGFGAMAPVSFRATSRIWVPAKPEIIRIECPDSEFLRLFREAVDAALYDDFPEFDPRIVFENYKLTPGDMGTT